MRYCIVLLTVLLSGLTTTTSGGSLVVGIYSDLGARESGLGTGFWLGDDGKIVTAYHVVVGARGITVVSGQRRYEAVSVLAIAPSWDLALLQVERAPRIHGYRLDLRPPRASELLAVEGYPRGIPEQRFETKATQVGFLKSSAISDDRGGRFRPLFRSVIDVVPLNLTVYGGMSGAPLESSAGVVGVVSGSLNEGGSVAWAIPAKYVEQLGRIAGKPKLPGQIAWPPFTLMASSWRSLRRDLSRNEGAALAIASFAETVAGLSASHTDVLVSASSLVTSATPSPCVVLDVALGSSPGAASITAVRAALARDLTYRFGVRTMLGELRAFRAAVERDAVLSERVRQQLRAAVGIPGLEGMTGPMKLKFERTLRRMRVTYAGVHDGGMWRALNVDSDELLSTLSALEGAEWNVFPDLEAANGTAVACGSLRQIALRLSVNGRAGSVAVEEMMMLEAYKQLLTRYYEYAVYREPHSLR